MGNSPQCSLRSTSHSIREVLTMHPALVFFSLVVLKGLALIYAFTLIFHGSAFLLKCKVPNWNTLRKKLVLLISGQAETGKYLLPPTAERRPWEVSRWRCKNLLRYKELFEVFYCLVVNFYQNSEGSLPFRTQHLNSAQSIQHFQVVNGNFACKTSHLCFKQGEVTAGLRVFRWVFRFCSILCNCIITNPLGLDFWKNDQDLFIVPIPFCSEFSVYIWHSFGLILL